MIFILDAYNVISKIKQSNKWQDRRRGFLRFLLKHPVALSNKNYIIVVFDGRRNPDIIFEFPSFEVVFSGDVTADCKINEILQKRRLSQAVVVSDDREVKFYAKRARARAISVTNFLFFYFRFDFDDKIGEDMDKKLSSRDIQEINAELEYLWLKKKKEES